MSRLFGPNKAPSIIIGLSFLASTIAISLYIRNQRQVQDKRNRRHTLSEEAEACRDGWDSEELGLPFLDPAPGTENEDENREHNSRERRRQGTKGLGWLWAFGKGKNKMTGNGDGDGSGGDVEEGEASVGIANIDYRDDLKRNQIHIIDYEALQDGTSTIDTTSRLEYGTNSRTGYG
jgi:hypothetical protein